MTGNVRFTSPLTGLTLTFTVFPQFSSPLIICLICTFVPFGYSTFPA